MFWGIFFSTVFTPNLLSYRFRPALEDDDDSRKRRRKKERSSIFFRKKKDKIGNSVSNIGKPTAIQHQHLMDAQQVR